MNNSTIQLKIKQRLNKIASSDYDNIDCWQIVEAFNKGMVDWLRRNLHGSNAQKEGDEQSKRRIDDCQVILIEAPVNFQNKQTYWEIPALPGDYFQFKRVTVFAKSDCCPDPKRMVTYEAEEGNVDELLRDKNKKPSYEWGETFCTLTDNKLRVYTNNEFSVNSAKLSYYRQPIRIQIAGCVDPYTLQTPAVDVLCEFKDDIVELFCDEAAMILAGDIESINQFTRNQQSAEGNN